MSVPQHNNSVYFVVIVIVRTKNYCVTTAVLQFTKEIYLPTSTYLYLLKKKCYCCSTFYGEILEDT